MEESTLDSSLINKIRSKLDPIEIVYSFIRIYGCGRVDDGMFDCMSLKLLCMAKEHRHKLLLTHLVSVLSCGFINLNEKLFVAIRTGNLAFVEMFIKSRSSVIRIDGQTFATALHIACIHDQAEILRRMLETSIERWAKARQSLLHYACAHGAYACVEYLLSTGACRCAVNVFVSEKPDKIKVEGGETFITGNPMMLGMRHGPPMVAMLLKAGAFVRFQTKGKRNTLLHIAVTVLLKRKALGKNVVDLAGVVRLLLDAGVSINERNMYNKTAVDELMLSLSNRAGIWMRSTDYLRGIVDIMWVLLTRDPQWDDFNVRGAPMRYLSWWLLRIISKNKLLASHPKDAADRDGELFQLAAQLLELFVKHDADQVVKAAPMLVRRRYELMNRRYETTHLIYLACMLKAERERLSTQTIHVSLFETMMNSFCNILRCKLLSGCTVLVDDNLITSLCKLFRQPCDQSLYFMRLLMIALTENQVNYIIRGVRYRCHWSDRLNLESIKLEIPFSLKDLARRAIVRALGCRTLREVHKLKLPLILQGYVLHLI